MAGLMDVQGQAGCAAVVIGASAGGIEALSVLLPMVPAGFRAALALGLLSCSLWEGQVQRQPDPPVGVCRP